MAILGSIFGAVGRLLNRLVNAALGWAGLLLFGKLPPKKQTVLLAMTLGSLLWVVTLVGVLFPDAGTFLIALAPVPQQISKDLVRLVMLVAAIVLPLLIGGALLFVTPADRRPKGVGLLLGVLRGYPFAFAMALTVAFLGVVATMRKAMSLVRRWEEAHVVVVVKPERYDELVADIEDALDTAGLAVDRKPAPAVLAAPARLLGRIAGSGFSDLVPDRLWRLVRPGLDILVHPSDVLVSGTREQVARARTAIAIRLTWAPAYLTTSPEAQKLEDAITSAGKLPPAEAAGKLRDIDRQLAQIVVPYEEWETLYRMRLQLQTELLGAEPDVAGQTGTSPVDEAAGSRGRATPATGNQQGERPPLLSWAAALGVAALYVLDVVLLARGSGRGANANAGAGHARRSLLSRVRLP